MTAPRLATEIDALVWDVAHLRDPDPATTLRLYAAAQRLTAVIREQFDANNDAGSEDGESGEGRHAGVADLERFLAGLAQFTRLSALDRCRAVPDMRGLAREALATEYGVALIQTGMRPADLARELGISTPRVRAAMRHGRSAEARRVVGLTAAESRSSDGRTQRDG